MSTSPAAAPITGGGSFVITPTRHAIATHIYSLFLNLPPIYHGSLCALLNLMTQQNFLVYFKVFIGTTRSMMATPTEVCAALINHRGERKCKPAYLVSLLSISNMHCPMIVSVSFIRTHNPHNTASLILSCQMVCTDLYHVMCHTQVREHSSTIHPLCTRLICLCHSSLM